jgi:hypothetical protein
VETDRAGSPSRRLVDRVSSDTPPDPAATPLAPATPNKVSDEPQGDTLSDDSQSPDSSTLQSSDRRAAEWVLSVGGNIVVATEAGPHLAVSARGPLPDGPFMLKKFHISACPQVTDDGLTNLRGCLQLDSINAWDTAITDLGLANLTNEGRQPLRNLQNLQIMRTAATDTGLRYFVGSQNINLLGIDSTQVRDGSLLQKFSQLNSLDIARTKIPAEDLSVLLEMIQLRILTVDGGQLQGVGSRYVSTLNKLTKLTVRDSIALFWTISTS